MAVTGASGFIGRALAVRLVRNGYQVRALARRPCAELKSLGVDVIRGRLEDEQSLERLVDGAGSVVHCAGAVKARRADDFHAVNVTGTENLLAAAGRLTPPPRFLFLSSLAAREPQLSAYAESKHGGEDAVRRYGADFETCIIRPPAIYGPGDRATLILFRQLKSGLLLVPVPPDARFSLLYVDDLAAALETLLEQPRWDGTIIELDDGHPGGYSWREIADIAGRQQRRAVRCIRLPRSLVWLFSLGDQTISRLLRRAPTLTEGKLKELLHPDWVSQRQNTSSRLLANWKPTTRFEEGFRQTMLWYKQRDWL